MNDHYKKESDYGFSLYLSNKDGVDGSIIIGGANLEKYAKANLTEEHIFWAKQSENGNYWGVNADYGTFGYEEYITNQT